MAPVQEEEITRVGVSIETSADDQTKQDHHAPETDSGSGSENGEKPVREKLKKTDLEEATHPSTRVEVVQEEEVGEQVGHGKLNKKRSFEDLEEKDEAGEPSTPSSGVHARKRSRDARSRHTKKSSSLKHSDTVPEDEEEDLEHSGDESDKLQDTPQSSGDESMGSANGVLEEKSSAHKFDVSEPASSRSKLPALDEMDERKSSPDSTERNNQEPLVVGIQTEGQGIKEVSNSITKEEPKVTRKRSRELMAEGEDGTDEMQDNNKVPATEKTKARRSSSPPNVLEPLTESKTAKDEVKSIKTVDSGGFANNSAVSPFASLSPRKSPSNTTPHDLPQTSASAFAASGFASMSGSTSPFGALGSSSTGSKSPPPSEPTQASSSAFAASGFASMTGNASAFGAIGTKSTGSASPFAAATPQSGFGSFGGKPLGSGLGSGFGGGSKLSSFAAPVGDAKLDKSKEAKPFGAPASDSESDSNEDDSGSDSKATDSKTEDEPVGETKVFGESSTDIAKDRKFKIRNAEVTGEEGEKVAFSSNAKLYQFVDRQWVERGSGVLKLNYTYSDLPSHLQASYDKDPDFRLIDVKPGEAKLEARLLMRNAATLKVLLNARIFKELLVGDQKGEEPSDRRFFVSAVPDTSNGKISTYLLKVGGNNGAQLLYTRVKQAQNML